MNTGIVGRIAVRYGMTKKEMVDLLNAHPHNGAYAKTVCRRCGAFTYNVYCMAENVKILDSCSQCQSGAD